MTQPLQPYVAPQPYPPYGFHPYLSPPPARVSPPVTGWVLLVVGAVTVGGSVTPWAVVHAGDATRTVWGTTADGAFTLAFGLAVAAAGLVIAVGQGRLWASIVALVFGAIATLTALIDIGNVRRGSPYLIDAYGLTYSVGFGLWSVLAGGVFAVLASIVAICVRR